MGSRNIFVHHEEIVVLDFDHSRTLKAGEDRQPLEQVPGRSADQGLNDPGIGTQGTRERFWIESGGEKLM